MFYVIIWNKHNYLFEKVTEARLFAISKIKNMPVNKKKGISIMRDDGWRLAPEEWVYAVKPEGKWIYLTQDDSTVRGRVTMPYTINKNGGLGHVYAIV